ncbi:MAG: DUF4347 domain-containing protein, partial [Comamonadaceae bacterium]
MLPASDAAAREPLSVYVVDKNVTGWQQLADQVPGGSQLILLDTGSDGVTQLADALRGRSDIDALYIASHGAVDRIMLGNSTVTAGNVDAHAADWRAIGAALKADGDILLYGCDVAAQGGALIGRLAELTSADVAASKNATGSAALGGDWALEARVGSIEAREITDVRYDGLLATSQPTVTLVKETGDPDGSLGDHLIGTNFNFRLRFDNTGSTAGYGPYIDLRVPQGADGNDGVVINGASYLGAALTVTTLTFDVNGQAVHPYAKDSAGNALIVSGTPGDRLAVIQLPFGSYTATQPFSDIVVSASLSSLADVGAADLQFSATGGFRFGDTPAADYATDPSVIGPIAGFVLTPSLVDFKTAYNGPEGETTSGPNFPRSITTTIQVAPGQTLTDYDVIVDLPDNVVVTGVIGGTTVGTLPAGATSGASVVQRFASLSGTQTVTVNYYVPDLNAAAAPILDPVSGAEVGTQFNVQGSGTWDPLDVRDPIQTATSNPAGFEAGHAIQSLAIQKSVAIATDANSSGYSPGDTLEYTIVFQLSDYFKFDQLKITDLIEDGQLLVGGSQRLTLTRQGVVGPTVAIGASSTSTAANNDVSFVYDISAAAGGDGSLTGGLFNGAANGLTTGILTYRTVVQNTFKSVTSGDLQVNQGDRLNTSATIQGRVVQADSTPGGVVIDDTGTSVPVVGGALRLTITQVNGSAYVPGASINPGDAVTYTMTYDLASGDYEQLRLDAYLPLPVFSTVDPEDDGVSTPNAFTQVPGTGVPPIGGWNFAENSLDDQPASVVSDADSNGVSFYFGDRADDDNRPDFIAIQFTLRVNDAPFADGLFLTAQAQATENNTPQQSTTLQAIDQIQLDEPDLVVRHGVSTAAFPLLVPTADVHVDGVGGRNQQREGGGGN